MEQLRSDAIRPRAVHYDAEMFVAMRRFHRQRVITDLAHGTDASLNDVVTCDIKYFEIISAFVYVRLK